MKWKTNVSSLLRGSCQQIKIYSVDRHVLATRAARLEIDHTEQAKPSDFAQLIRTITSNNYVVPTSNHPSLA